MLAKIKARDVRHVAERCMRVVSLLMRHLDSVLAQCVGMTKGLAESSPCCGQRAVMVLRRV